MSGQGRLLQSMPLNGDSKKAGGNRGRSRQAGRRVGGRRTGGSLSLSGKQGQVEKHLAGHGKNSEFYLKGNGKPLKEQLGEWCVLA